MTRVGALQVGQKKSRKPCSSVERSGVGTKYAVWLPDCYADETGQPVAAEVCEMPFRPSVNPNAREVAKAEGRDAAF